VKSRSDEREVLRNEGRKRTKKATIAAITQKEKSEVRYLAEKRGRKIVYWGETRWATRETHILGASIETMNTQAGTDEPKPNTPEDSLF